MSSIQTLHKILNQSTTGEYIAADAPHWALEPYIPMTPDELQRCLLDRDELAADQQAGFAGFAHALAAVLHHYEHHAHAQLSRTYAALDPDNESARRRDSLAGINASAETSTETIRAALLTANFTPLSREDLEAAVGVASQWGVPLHVDFEVFKQLAVYTRGDIMGVRTLRSWSRPWREQMVDVPIYQRVVVVFQLTDQCRTDDELDPNRLHLRLFKNIPKLDVDMLLPGTRVRISWLDRTRIVVPSLGGIGMTIWKIVRTALFVAALSVYTAAILAGLVLAALGYIVRTVISYFQTRDRYMLNMTRSLYYQKLDSNAGVIYRLREESQQQQCCEIMLAYYCICSQDGPISRRKLKRRAQRMIRESIRVEIDYDVDKALALMEELGLCTTGPDGKVTCPTTGDAVEKLNAWWDRQSLATAPEQC